MTKRMDVNEWARQNPKLAQRPFIRGMLASVAKLPAGHPLARLYTELLQEHERLLNSR